MCDDFNAKNWWLIRLKIVIFRFFIDSFEETVAGLSYEEYVWKLKERGNDISGSFKLPLVFSSSVGLIIFLSNIRAILVLSFQLFYLRADNSTYCILMLKIRLPGDLSQPSSDYCDLPQSKSVVFHYPPCNKCTRWIFRNCHFMLKWQLISVNTKLNRYEILLFCMIYSSE